MSETTKISWSDATWSPWWGCTEVSPACDHCYARTLSKRAGFQIWGQDVGRRKLSENHWKQPRLWDRKAKAAGKPMRVFPSMCDPFEDRRDLDSLRATFWGLIRDTPNLLWLLLTKRPQAIRRLYPADWLETPPRNVMLMATVETAQYLWRIDALKAAPAVAYGLSIEPLLGPMLTLGEYLDGIDVCIVGGESGAGARPMHPDWARSVRDQCLAKGVTFHLKQMCDRHGRPIPWKYVPRDLQMQEFPEVRG